MNGTGIPWSRNAAILVPVWTLLYAGYQVSNRVHLVAPRFLPMTVIDRALPFMLWTIWPYFLLILFVFLPLGIRGRPLFRRTMWAYTFALLLNISIWMLLPTIYPRPPHLEGGGLAGFAYRWLCSIDTPANCLPSGHITSPTVACWALSREHLRHRAWIWPSLLLISLSTLTMKQHYVWDVPAGFLTAALGIWASRWVTPGAELRA